jgi:hypothetical protein
MPESIQFSTSGVRVLVRQASANSAADQCGVGHSEMPPGLRLNGAEDIGRGSPPDHSHDSLPMDGAEGCPDGACRRVRVPPSFFVGVSDLRDCFRFNSTFAAPAHLSGRLTTAMRREGTDPADLMANSM